MSNDSKHSIPCPGVAPIFGHTIPCNKIYQHNGACLNYELVSYWCWPCESFGCEHLSSEEIVFNIDQQLTTSMYTYMVNERERQSRENMLNSFTKTLEKLGTTLDNELEI